MCFCLCTVARDMADDDSKADKHSGGGLSPDSTQCPSASVHRIQRSRGISYYVPLALQERILI